MINKILKKHKLTMEQFHDKYPTEADFAKAHPKDYAELQKFASGGKLPEGILRARLESHMSSDEAQDYINEYGKGGYTVTRSNDRKGKTHKVTGPDGTVKYFGDSKLGQHPGNPKRKKAFYARHAKNLKNNPYFRAFARATWAEGGYLDDYTEQDFAKGGLFSSISGNLEGLGSMGDILMGGAEAAYNLMPALSMPITAVTGKDLSSLVGYDYQTDLGKKFDKGTDIYSKVSGTAAKMAAPIAGNMMGIPAPVTNMGMQMAGQGINNLTNQQTFAAKGGELVDLVGPKHTEGGIMLTNNAEVEGGETKLGNYIYSDQLEYQPGVTFAKQSKKIKNRYKLRKGGDLIDNEQMNRELMDLQDANEEARVASEAEEAFEMAKGGWIKKATESIKRRGTEGVCSGSKFGGPTCPPGSKRYNLAKTFRKMAKARKHEEGGFVGHMYDMGGDIEMFDTGGNMLSNLFSMAQPGIDYANMEVDTSTPYDLIENTNTGYSDAVHDALSDAIHGQMQRIPSLQGRYMDDIFGGDYLDYTPPMKPIGTKTIKTSSAPNSLALPPAKDPNKPDWDAVNKYLNTPKPESQSAAQLFGKYGSLLGLPLQGLAVGQANRAIKDEIKRLEGQKPEVVDYGTVSLQGYKPSLMDPTQALLEADQVARTNAYNSAQIGAGNLGTAMANKQISDLTALRNKAKTRKEYDNLNREIENRAAEYAAQVGNQGTLYNKELERAGMDASSLARANYQNQLFKLRQAMGQNRASGLQAGAQGLGATAQNVNYNQQLLSTLGQLFSNPDTLKMLAQYGVKAGQSKT